MSIVEYTTIGGGLSAFDKRTIKRFWWLEQILATKKRNYYASKLLRDLPLYSLLSQVGDAWALLTAGEKASWDAAADYSGLIGWNLFTQDKSFRIQNGIAGNATPSINHQYLVSHFNLTAGVNYMVVKQKGFSTLVFPGTLRMSVKTALEADGVDNPFLRLWVEYYYNAGLGVQVESNFLDIPISAGWQKLTLTIPEQVNPTGTWDFELEAYGVKGDFWFDNLYLDAASGLIGRDPHCEQTNKKWTLMEFPAGVTMETIYPTGAAL